MQQCKHSNQLSESAFEELLKKFGVREHEMIGVMNVITKTLRGEVSGRDYRAADVRLSFPREKEPKKKSQQWCLAQELTC